jgi:hypothetical protein
MILEIRPEQKRILERAAKSGMSPEEVLDQAFAIIREQYRNGDWMKPDKDAIAAQIEEGYGQAMRGELLNADEAVRSLHARRAKRKTA